MVDKEAVWLAALLAVGAQGGRDLLALLARVREDQALAATRMLEDVGETRVCVLGRAVRDLCGKLPLRG